MNLYDVQNRKWRQLGPSLEPGGYGYMAWSQDSAYIYFDGTINGVNGFFRLRVSDKKLDEIVNFKKIQRFGDQSFGAWSGLGPGGVPLFMRDISTQEIYALDMRLP